VTTTASRDLPIPGDPSDLTPDWLTQALRSRLPDHPVIAGVDREDVGSGQGFTGQVVRLKLSYAAGVDANPRQLIAKMAAPPGSARDLLQEFGGYEREGFFYMTLAEKCGLPAPRCYFAGYDSSSGNLALLLEDMAPAKVGDQVAGATLADAELCVTEMAKFHARWWNDSWLLDQPWLRPARTLSERLPQLYQQGLEPLRTNMQGRYPRVLRLVERMGPLVPLLASMVREEFPPKPFTLVHGDFRLDNLFLPSPEDSRLVVIDWQGAAVGSPGNELAYWLILSVPVDVRRAHEEALLKRYHSVLVENGVEDYSFRSLRRDYANGILIQLAGLPVLSANLDFSSGRGEELAAAALERLDAAAVDLKAARTIAVLPWFLRIRNASKAVRRAITRSGDAG
jgi:hypothetical protein